MPSSIRRLKTAQSFDAARRHNQSSLKAFFIVPNRSNFYPLHEYSSRCAGMCGMPSILLSKVDGDFRLLWLEMRGAVQARNQALEGAAVVKVLLSCRENSVIAQFTSGSKV